MNHEKIFLRQAIEKSRESVMMGELPVGSLIVLDGKIIGAGVANIGLHSDPTSHAEIAAIREASRAAGRQGLAQAVLYSSMEPCLMCYGATFWASISHIVYACRREKVAKFHYEGSHDLITVNNLSYRPATLVHIPELEPEALKVISEWEAVAKNRRSNES